LLRSGVAATRACRSHTCGKKGSAIRILNRFFLFAVGWSILTSNDAAAWVVGAVAAVAATALSVLLLPPAGSPVRLGPMFRIIPHFIWVSFRGGLDIAWRVFHPNLPLDSSWVKYFTRLPPGMARFCLSNEVSLMPGTLIAGATGDILHVHCIDRRQPVFARIAEEERRICEAAGIDPLRSDE
jgi:multicomponent Na+:H+ antiporter subunit E